MFVPNNEIVLIDNYLAAAQAQRDQPLADDVAFELFAAQMALHDRNLNDDEIALGRIGGGQDGGIDGVYVFLDDDLLDDDSTLFTEGLAVQSIRKYPNLTLRLVQAKRETSFTETTFDKAQSSLGRLLELTMTDEQLGVYYSPELIGRMRLFTQAWTILAVKSPVVRVEFDYVTKGDTTNVHPAVEAKRADLGAFIESKVQGATTYVRLLGASELWTLANSLPAYDLALRFVDYLSEGESYAGLVSLADFYEFLSEDDGSLREHLFDWNVRDFQGDVTVNKEIRATLESTDTEDFWWFNNGVTILCAAVSIGAHKTFTMQNVQIVNGMQTSHSIHSAIGKITAEVERLRNRSLLVRVFKTDDSALRDRVIRATNSQTKVPDASLHATEDIHRKLEAHFLANGWFYDRRKNYYKNHGKPADRIVSISGLGQAVMAIGLSRPDSARARPTTILNNAEDYKSIFSERVPLDTYLWLAQTQRAIENLMQSPDSFLASNVRTNLRFHISMFMVTQALGARIYSPLQLKELSENPLPLDSEYIELIAHMLQEDAEFNASWRLWTVDRVVKSREFAERVIDRALGIDPDA